VLPQQVAVGLRYLTLHVWDSATAGAPWPPASYVVMKPPYQFSPTIRRAIAEDQGGNRAEFCRACADLQSMME
jgi:hypothetical protein